MLSWHEIVQQKLQADRAKILAAWLLEDKVVQEGKTMRRIAGDLIESLLDSGTLRITAMDVPELTQRMGTAALTAVQVVTAFSKRAAYAHQILSTELRYLGIYDDGVIIQLSQSGLLLEIGCRSDWESA